MFIYAPTFIVDNTFSYEDNERISDARFDSMTQPDTASLDLTRFIRPGDAVLVGQGCGEPCVLTRALVSQRGLLGGVKVVLCTVVSETFQPEHSDHLAFVVIGVTSGTRALSTAGALDVLPVHYGDIEKLLRDGDMACDVVMVQVAPPDAQGRYSLGATHDYLAAAIPRARVVIAEVNQRAPTTLGETTFSRNDFTCIVETDSALIASPGARANETDDRIGALVAGLVPDGATLQLGIGGIPEAVLARLSDRRGLGFHSGMMSDRVCDLMESGAIDNANKGIDPGRSVTGVLLGTERLFRFAHRNPAVFMRGPGYTHAAGILARVRRLFSINSAIEVDLSGQVNAEAMGGRYVGAIGGQVDFVRGARLSEGGRSVIALPSTHGKTRQSRIVARLNGPVTTPRSDADTVVTEWGAAHLRGRSLRERMQAMIAIADPQHREALERGLHDLRPELKGG